MTGEVHWVKGNQIAEELGNVRAANVVLLGALSALTQFDPAAWRAVLELRIPPKYIELNRKAFQAGAQAGAVGIIK